MSRFVGIIVFFLIMNNLQAQLCNGSLGDPIVHISFGRGANPGNALPAASTSYQYVATDCPNDGYYAVRNTTNGCFGASWHNVSADHTGDGSGYFMLVNASVQPGAFYIDTVRGLCGGTTYEFAAWIMNVLLPTACGGSGTLPDLTFTVERTDGTVLQTYNTGSIAMSASPTWHQYGSYFTTPAGVSDIVLRIVNNAPGGCGNDIALDDITFRACGPQVSGTIDGIPDYDTSFCEGPLQQFLVNCNVSGGFTTPVYQWQHRNPGQSTWTDIPMANATSLNVIFVANAAPGLYEMRLAIAESGNMASPACRVYSKSFSFIIHALPTTTVSNNGPVCENGSLQLTATGGDQYNWTGPNAFSATGSSVAINGAQLTHAGQYDVVVTSTEGCSKPGFTTVVVNPVPLASVTIDKDTICFRETAQLLAAGGTSYQWIPASGLSSATINNPVASPTQTTGYEVIVSNAFNCRDTADILVTVIPKPVANAGPDKIIFEGQSTVLSGSHSGNIASFSWSPPDQLNDILLLQPTANPLSDQTYTLTVLSEYGCGTASDQVTVKVFKDIFVPTAFTPNRDGINDTWKVLGIEALSAYRVSVFNRWGERVFHTTQWTGGWDGTYKGMPQPAGVYIYYIEQGPERGAVKGSFVLIR